MFITVGLRLGVENYYQYFTQFGLLNKTGVDLPGEAGTIMHKMEDMKAVELATVSFGQSFQITPIQLITTASSIVNGGKRITPHFAVMTANREGTEIERFSYPEKEHIVSEETSATMRMILEQVVENGSGKNGLRCLPRWSRPRGTRRCSRSGRSARTCPGPAPPGGGCRRRNRRNGCC